MQRDEMNETPSRTPETSQTKPMDSKRDVEKSPDPKTDQDFPGYPHYPAKDDIMDQRTGSHRVDANAEEVGTGPNASGVSQRYAAGQGNQQQSPAGSEAEGEGNDLMATDSRKDEIGTPQNVSNEDLGTDDVSGTNHA